MKYLITGATGFLGKHLVNDILKDGANEVWILSRSDRKSSKERMHFLKWDGTSIPAEIGPMDVVINLAGAGIADKPWSDSYKKIIQESRINTSQACVKFIQDQETKPKVFLAGSAVGFYGGDRKGKVDESSEPGNDFMADTCVKWEEASKGSGIRTVFLRTGVVFGTDDGPLPVLIKPFQFFVGGPVADGDQYLPWIHIRDWIDAVRYVEKTETIEGPVILAAPQPSTNQYFAETVGSILKRPSFFRVPKFALDLMMGEQAIIAWGSLQTDPQVLESSDFSFKYPDLKSALKDLLD